MTKAQWNKIPAKTKAQMLTRLIQAMDERSGEMFDSYRLQLDEVNKLIRAERFKSYAKS